MVYWPGRMQLWKPDGEDCGLSDHYSKATFALKAEEGGTRLAFTQTGVPVDCGDRFDTGWKENYWVPMKDMLESRTNRVRK